MSKYRVQHLVSQVILRRFADAGQVLRINLETGKTELRNPARVMYQTRFISADAKGAEDLWGSVETALRPALDALDSDTLFENRKHISAVKDCMALHFARSHIMIWTRRAAMKRAAAKLREVLINEQRDWLARRFFVKHGHFPVGGKALEAAANEFIEEAAPQVDNAESFSASVKRVFAEVKQRFGSSGLEIGRPEHDAGEFLIGDAPALTLKGGSMVGGPHGGVTLDDANTVMMPLGPKHVASLGQRDMALPQFSSKHVAMVNEAQVLSAFKEVCLRPNSGLEPFVKHLRTKRQPKDEN
jgi:hypothetical protein